MKTTLSVRDQMAARLPHFLQPFLTWLTGKPYTGQKKLFSQNALTQTASTLSSIFLGILIATLSLKSGFSWPLLFLPLGWLLLAGGARKMQVMLLHQCAHFQFSGNRTRDRRFFELMSSFLFLGNFNDYLHDHVTLHHGRALATAADPDCAFLLELGFLPGMTRPQLWRHLAITIVSPRFHGIFLRARLRNNFVTAPFHRKCMVFLWTAILLGLTWFTKQWDILLFAWFIPLTLCYHVAALLNFSSLHLWHKKTQGDHTRRDIMPTLTNGRFPGEALPESSSLLAWSLWWFKLLLWHLPVRLGVLVGDLPVHDYHHRYPRCKDWANVLYTRQQDVEKGMPGFKVPYTEKWGLIAAIDSVFETIAAAVPLKEEPAKLDDAQILVI